MHLFYSENPLGETLILGAEESGHAIRVLRLKKGDSITVTDGRGMIGKGTLTHADAAGCTVRLDSIGRGADSRDYRLHIAISPTAGMERLEWFVEKAVEIGVDEISPIICEHSVRKTVRTDRLRKIVVAAMKQSLKSSLALINEPIPFSAVISAETRCRKLIAHCREGLTTSMAASLERKSDYLILIGPEGDFSRPEIEEAEMNGFLAVSMGQSRLRTETAGIAACYSVYFVNL